MDSKIEIQDYDVTYDKSYAMVICALLDGKFVGSCTCGLSKNVISIYNFSVNNENKRMGVAQEMLRYAVEHGKIGGWETITTIVFKNNTAAYGCYRKAGFRIMEEREDSYLMGMLL